MRSLQFFFLPLILILALNLAAHAKVKFPFVSQMHGVAEWVSKDGRAHSVKKEEIFKEKLHLRTKNGVQVRVELDEHNSLTLLENSEMEIAVIDWDTGDTAEVHLLAGQLRVESQGMSQRIYSTPVTRDVYNDAAFVLSYDAASAKAVLVGLRGVVNFRGYEGEVSARVGAGERASFQGIIEGGVPSFDVLLKGRKLARGHLSSVEKVSEAELDKLEKVSMVQKPKPPKLPPKPPRQPDQICDEPYGRLNECVWTCEGLPKKSTKAIKSCDGHECVRRRCDANGQWSDAYQVPGSEGKCQVSPVIAPCDY